MEPFIVIADRYAKNTLADLAHSALPGAPQQPYVERRRRWRWIVDGWRRRPTAAAGRPLGSVGRECRPLGWSE